MSEPFEYLEEEEEVSGGGIGWMPLSLAGVALAGSLAVPTVGFLKRKDKSDDWSRYAMNDPIPVAVDNFDSFDPLLTPNPEDLQLDLQSVDETLGGLGDGDGKASSDVPPLKEKTAKRKPTAISKVKSRPGGPSYDWAVKEGETLYGIGRKTGTTPDMIAKTSGIGVNDPIVPGQVLKIPGHRPVEVKPIVVGSKSDYPNPRTSTPERVTPPTEPIARERIPEQAPYPETVLPSYDQTHPLFPNQSTGGGPAYNPTRPVIAQPRPGGTPSGPQDYSQAYPQTNPQAYPPVYPQTDPSALPRTGNPLDRYSHAIAYRVQAFESINRIADAHAITVEELIQTNGRAKVKKGEMLVVPVDNCLIKNE